MKEKVLFCWSGGKDSAMALHRLLADERYEIVALLTTYNEHSARVSMHGVSLALSHLQAQSIGLPLEKVFVSERGSNEEYSLKMAERMLAFKERGVTTVAFGDIFLEDLRQWREANLAEIGMHAIFPLWKNDTRSLMEEFLDLGFAARVCCVNAAVLGEDALGREIDHEFIASLPGGVDPCGENGEFHTFAYAGPIFKERLSIVTGDCVSRDGFLYCDLSAESETAAKVQTR